MKKEKAFTGKIFFVILLILSGTFHEVAHARPERISLSGRWSLSLDAKDFKYTINLPGSTDEIGLGKEHLRGTKLYTGDPETWQLTRKHVLIDTVWYQKEVEIPADWLHKNVVLSLERCMWQTSIWINGQFVGKEHSLCTPHKYDISPYLQKGKNRILLAIDNTPYTNLGSWSHGYAPGIQTIWNGAIGELFLEAKDRISVGNIQCYSSLKDKRLQVKGCLINTTKKEKRGHLVFRILDSKGTVVLKQKKKLTSLNDTTSFTVLLQLEDSLRAWDEYTPNLYVLQVDYKFGSHKGTEKNTFGFRDIEAKDGRLMLNGYTLFLRGEHDPGSFPLTGYPSMKKEDWLRIFRTGKEYGLNHWRFHSWCPPEAAFEAADEVGIYLQPELPLFSQKWENTLMGQDSVRDEFLFSELRRILDTYGNHPSFLLMCMGNELKGDASVLEKWVQFGKHYDRRHLYASNANLEAMGRYQRLAGDEFQVAHAAKVNGRRYERRMGQYFNSERPNTTNDYSHTLVAPYDRCPVITHELGQWEVYPDFSEIDRYTGVLAPNNLKIFKNSLEQKGMGDMGPAFLKASGKLATILYKEEMERVLRTPDMDGFQMLDLRDYPAQGSALVGLLNVFWDSKGLVTPEEFRQSCNDLTLLLKMPKRTWTNHETFHGEIVCPNYSRETLKDVRVRWEITCDGHTIHTDSLNCETIPQGEVFSCGNIALPLNKFNKAVKLEICMQAPSLGISNHYNVWVYPKELTVQPGKVMIASEATPQLFDSLSQGATVLLVPQKVPDAERTTFTTPFWSTQMFDYQPKTMGLVCDPSHPLFKDFPTDGYTDWQWWELLHSASAARLNRTPADYRPILQIIDHPVRNDKLGAIMETRVGKGRLLICTLDILSSPEERVVARQLKYSILTYMNSADFHPEAVPGLAEIFFRNIGSHKLYKSIQGDSGQPEHPAAHLCDGLENTYYALPDGPGTVSVMLELPEERYITGCALPVPAEGIRTFRVYVTNHRGEKGNVMIEGNGTQAEYKAKSWDNGFTVQQGKKGKYVIIELDKQKDQAARLPEFQLRFGD